MVYRAIRISSTYQTPHKEYLFIRQQSVSSGYPFPFVLDIIRITLDTHLYNYISTTSPIETDSSPPKNIKRGPDKKMYLKDMYVLQIFHMWVDKYHPMEKKLIDIAKSVCPQIHIQPIARSLPLIQLLFPRKDPLPNDLTSPVIYNIRCIQRPASYIRMTHRQPAWRFLKH